MYHGLWMEFTQTKALDIQEQHSYEEIMAYPHA